ncbi:DPP IV N-terminal domain-containing protein [Myxococcaceae bacterium JPH2]|nr:DPP IV N-terminal domain-containing protein [Myxococcaceae bacterium JPH2]
MSCVRLGFAVLALLGVPALTQAAEPPSSAFLRQLSETRYFSTGRPMGIQIAPDGKTVFFLRSPPSSDVMTLYAFDTTTGQTTDLLDPERLLRGAEETLTTEERARRERLRTRGRGFTSYTLSEDGSRILLPLSGKLYVLERASGKVTELHTGAGAMDPKLSQDGSQVAYVRDHDVYRVDFRSNTEHAVTRGGTQEKEHGVAEFVAQEEMGRDSGYWWSPDAKAIAFAEVDVSQVDKRLVADVTHPERGAESFAFPRAGGPNARVRLGIASLTGGPTVWAKWDQDAYPYLATVRWPRKGPLTVLVQNRAQTEERLLSVEPRTGNTRTLLVEKDEAWLNLDQRFPSWLADGSGFLWCTERNGAPEVERRHADGRLARSLVPPSAGFRALVRYVDAQDALYFLGGPNPTERYLWRVQGGGVPTRVTPDTGPALESGWVAASGALLVVPSEGPRTMRQFPVLRADGTRVGLLPSLAVQPPFFPRFEVQQVGPERFWASIVRPRDFKPGVKLPVIVNVYGGPLETVVHQSMEQHLLAQWMADQGYLVVRFDGRGTPLRGRAWERAIKYDFYSVPLDDQIAALRALAAEVPEMDLNRVGIEGWSFGGDMAALAVLKRPDVFKAAAAGAATAVQDDYDTHYTERYLGLPQEHPEAYSRTSLVTYIHEDKPVGKLLLLHGTGDDNVYFFNALKLSDALFRAGKHHELLAISGATHRVADPLLNMRRWERVMSHFHDNL